MSQLEKEKPSTMTPRQILGWGALNIAGTVVGSAIPIAWLMFGLAAGALLVLFVLMIIYWPRRSRA